MPKYLFESYHRNTDCIKYLFCVEKFIL